MHIQTLLLMSEAMKIVLTLLALAIGLSVAAVYTLGIRPRPIAEIDPSVVQSPERIGQVVHQYALPKIKTEKVVVVGVDPSVPDYAAIWDGFVAEARAKNEAYTTALIQTGLNAKGFSGLKTEEMDFSRQFDQLVERIKQSPQNERLFIFGMDLISAHRLGADAYIQRLENALQTKLYSFTLLPYAVSKAGLDRFDFGCDSEGRKEFFGPHYLDCASLAVSKKFFKKKKKDDERVMVLERHGVTDYLVFVHTPKASPNL